MDYYYVIFVSGWEEYYPVWFKCDLPQEKFEEQYKIALNKAIDKLCDTNDSYIDGHDLINEIIPYLESVNIKVFKCNKEYGLGGSIFYDNRSVEDKPDLISDEYWDKIVKHNNDRRDDNRNKRNKF